MGDIEGLAKRGEGGGGVNGRKDQRERGGVKTRFGEKTIRLEKGEGVQELRRKEKGRKNSIRSIVDKGGEERP